MFETIVYSISTTHNKGCVTLALPFTLKSIVRQKKNYATQIFHHGKM